jgi:deoxyribonuclease-2
MFLFGLFFISAFALQCYDDTNQLVDSWFAIKEPKGTYYVYTDPLTPFLPSHLSLNDTVSGALASTLKQLWVEGTEYILFNDEPPTGYASGLSGHTKGIWAWNDKEAFVLTHSIPLFPKGPMTVSSYEGLGSNAYIYGQSIACFSFSLSTLVLLAEQMILTAPDIYEKKTGPNTPIALQTLAGGFVSKEPLCNSSAVFTVGGLPIVFFSKSSQWNNELYSQCIALTLHESLFAETWIRGSATGPSCSGKYHVNDISLLELPFNDIYKETQDHSKWAIGKEHVCVADINRMLTQYKRGGGAFCFTNPALANVLNETIQASNKC